MIEPKAIMTTAALCMPVLPVRTYPTMTGAEIDQILSIHKLYMLCMLSVPSISEETRCVFTISEDVPKAFPLLACAFREAAQARIITPDAPAVAARYDAAHGAMLNIACLDVPRSAEARNLLTQFYLSSVSLFDYLCALHRDARAALKADKFDLIAKHQLHMTTDALNRLAGLGQGDIHLRALAVLNEEKSPSPAATCEPTSPTPTPALDCAA